MEPIWSYIGPILAQSKILDHFGADFIPFPPNYVHWHWQKNTVLWSSLGVIFGAIWCCLRPIWSHHNKIWDIMGTFSWPPVGLLVFCIGLNPSEFDGAIIGNWKRRTGFWPPIGTWVFSRLNIPQLSAVVSVVTNYSTIQIVWTD